MVAKFNGEELPIDQDPFEPMKKALEEEEKKELLEKGVDTDTIPLVLTPEKIEEKAEQTTPFPSIPQATDPNSITLPEFAQQTSEENSDITSTPQTSSEPEPEQTTLSLDDIVDTAIPQAPAPQPQKTSMDANMAQLLDKLKNPRVLLGVGGAIVVIFVLVLMFPTMFSPTSPAPLPPEQPIEQFPVEEEPIHSAPDTTPNLPTEPITPSEPTTPIEPTLPTEPIIPDEPMGPIEPYIPEEEITPIPDITSQITPQAMKDTLTSLSNQSKQLLDIGEMDDDKELIKYAGYIQYQADFMINQLESGTSFSIDYYTAMTDRMNTLLTYIHNYTNGGEFPEFPVSPLAPEDEFQKAELQNFIYENNGIFSS
jgi:hypothetical protein